MTRHDLRRVTVQRSGEVARADGAMAPAVINQHLTKSMYAYHEMRRMVLEGVLKPGSRLPLRELAEQMGLSIQPIRDAIKMLERDGLVETEFHHGATVTEISDSQVTDLLSTRLWLEILAVQEAVPHHTETSLTAVKQALQAAELTMKTEADAQASSQASRRLHEAIEATAPVYLRELISDLWEQLWQAQRRTPWLPLVPAGARSAHREHKKLVAAVVSGDAQAAAAAMAQHRKSTLAAWRKALHASSGE